MFRLAIVFAVVLCAEDKPSNNTNNRSDWTAKNRSHGASNSRSNCRSSRRTKGSENNDHFRLNCVIEFIEELTEATRVLFCERQKCCKGFRILCAVDFEILEKFIGIVTLYCEIIEVSDMECSDLSGILLIVNCYATE